jgi:hypothetical protein
VIKPADYSPAVLKFIRSNQLACVFVFAIEGAATMQHRARAQRRPQAQASTTRATQVRHNRVLIVVPERTDGRADRRRHQAQARPARGAQRVVQPAAPRATTSRSRSRPEPIPASSRLRSTASISAPTSKARRTPQRETFSSTTPAQRRPRCATRTGKCTTQWRNPGRRAGSCPSSRSTGHWSRTSSAIPSRRPSASRSKAP